MHQKLAPDPFLILLNNSKQTLRDMQEILLKVRNFEKWLSKSLKKVNFIFSFEPSPFLWTKLLKTKELWN